MCFDECRQKTKPASYRLGAGMFREKISCNELNRSKFVFDSEKEGKKEIHWNMETPQFSTQSAKSHLWRTL